MKLSFSTLACPGWDLDTILKVAHGEGFQGVELRFIEDDGLLWKRPEFVGSGLRTTLAKLADMSLQVCCVDTSCFFHSPDSAVRREMVEQGERMLELAARLGAPGIRVFGDRVQPGATRESTRQWIAEAMSCLAARGGPGGIEVWLESHGEFASATETLYLLQLANVEGLGVVWDPANAYAESGEVPAKGFGLLGDKVRHVHIKDARRPSKADPEDKHPLWDPVLMGEGHFPAGQLLSILYENKYDRFVSFEWEKKWHPGIPDPEVALPHFIRWFREVSRRLIDH
jgi:sugar phosphate isomerase/epimerase